MARDTLADCSTAVSPAVNITTTLATATTIYRLTIRTLFTPTLATPLHITLTVTQRRAAADLSQCFRSQIPFVAWVIIEVVTLGWAGLGWPPAG